MAVTKQQAPAIYKAFNPASDRERENNPIIPQRVPAQTIKNDASIRQCFWSKRSILPLSLHHNNLSNTMKTFPSNN